MISEDLYSQLPLLCKFVKDNFFLYNRGVWVSFRALFIWEESPHIFFFVLLRFRLDL